MGKKEILGAIASQIIASERRVRDAIVDEGSRFTASYHRGARTAATSAFMSVLFNGERHLSADWHIADVLRSEIMNLSSERLESEHELLTANWTAIFLAKIARKARDDYWAEWLIETRKVVDGVYAD